MEKIKNFIIKNSDNILIAICLFLAVLFSSFLSDVLDIYNITSLHRIMITGFTVASITFIDVSFQTLKHKTKK